MKPLPLFATLALVLGLAACVHTPPGTSVNVALAKKAEPVVLASAHPMVPGGLPLIEPELPQNPTVERVAEAYSRGQFCMQAGKDPEAIAAFEEAVKIDPRFTEAWQRMAILYAKVGDDKKALAAFRRAKEGATVVSTATR